MPAAILVTPARALPAVRPAAAPAPRPVLQPMAAINASAGAAGGPSRPEQLPSDHGQAAQRWQREMPDPTWTAATLEHLRSSFTDLGTRAEVRDVSCRATLCRAQIVFETVAEATRYADEGAHLEVSRWLVSHERDGKFEVDVIAAR